MDFRSRVWNGGTLEGVLARARAKSQSSIVGFYRISSGNDLVVTLDDVVFMSRHFQGESNVLLLVGDCRTQPRSAGFVIWEDSRIRPGQPYLQFPFTRAALAECARTKALTDTIASSLPASDRARAACGWLHHLRRRFNSEMCLGLVAAWALALALMDESEYGLRPHEAADQLSGAALRLGPVASNLAEPASPGTTVGVAKDRREPPLKAPLPLRAAYATQEGASRRQCKKGSTEVIYSIVPASGAADSS